MKFGPFGQVHAIALRVVRWTLDREYFKRIFFYCWILYRVFIEWRFLANKVYWKRGPLNIESMEHIISIVIKIEDFTFFEIFFSSNKYLRLLLLIVVFFLGRLLGNLISTVLLLVRSLFTITFPNLFFLILVSMLVLKLSLGNFIMFSSFFLHSLGAGLIFLWIYFFYLACLSLHFHYFGELLNLLILSAHHQQRYNNLTLDRFSILIYKHIKYWI